MVTQNWLYGDQESFRELLSLKGSCFGKYEIDIGITQVELDLSSRVINAINLKLYIFFSVFRGPIMSGLNFFNQKSGEFLTTFE